MVSEIAKPVALLLCILSLCAVFYTAFLVPASGLEQNIGDSLVLLSLAAGISMCSGLIFRDSPEHGPVTLMRTLPVQMFFWGVCVMVLLFLASWYLETHCVFYRDVRRF